MSSDALKEPLQKAGLGTLVTLFDIDFAPAGFPGVSFHWVPAVNQDASPIRWRGTVYVPSPIFAEGFELS